MREKIINAADLPDVCTPQIAADFLGISRSRIYEYCQLSPEANGIPSYTIGGSRKIDKQDLLQWKEAQKKAAQTKFLS
ncbi:helix-turn-helix domain-containing protein [Paenibacillus senegalensis]|uniref:helix-turn-helix domain-containing protein n=1 Tax=Paenibacillus senegalensis TaxID=1465766 RepID=UPI000287DC83|nr:helix-turn-helix domain-containing protein [Paenibacillus senegalensis]